MLINKLSSTVKNSYEVILGISVKAHQHWRWAREIYTLLEKNKDAHDTSTWFLVDTFKAHQTSAAHCLMNLYEKENDALWIGKFLKLLENELQALVPSDNLAQKYLGLIKDDLRSLKRENKDIQRKLRLIRNKKYSHTDPKNAAGQLFVDTVPELTSGEIDSLLAKIEDIISHYGDLFDRLFQNYLSSSTVVKDAINKLEHAFFNSKCISEV